MTRSVPVASLTAEIVDAMRRFAHVDVIGHVKREDEGRDIAAKMNRVLPMFERVEHQIPPRIFGWRISSRIIAEQVAAARERAFRNCLRERRLPGAGGVELIPR